VRRSTVNSLIYLLSFTGLATLNDLDPGLCMVIWPKSRSVDDHWLCRSRTTPPKLALQPRCREQLLGILAPRVGGLA
jgi:hypothetical protein